MVVRSAVALVACILFAPEARSQPLKAARTDALGDALPAGAVARLGTLRFKHEPGRIVPDLPGGVSRQQHFGLISEAVFSPSGKNIASLAGNQDSIRLWAAASGSALHGPWSSSDWFF